MRKMAAHQENLVVLGAKGTGKTALGKFLRKELSSKESQTHFLEIFPLYTNQLKAFYDLIFHKTQQREQNNDNFSLIQKPPLVFIEDVSLNPLPNGKINFYEYFII